MIKTLYKRTYTENWDFRDSNTKEITHSYHNYPAMMIPQIARKLINEFAPKDKLEIIFDPYMGSGSTAVACKLLGKDYIGIDISKNYINKAEERINNYESEQYKLDKELKNHIVKKSYKQRQKEFNLRSLQNE